jgi:putative inorganic carbon (HCO3(-)) transporter
MTWLDKSPANGAREETTPGRWRSAPALLLAAYVSLLPIQFLGAPSGSSSGPSTIFNIAPADIVLVAYLALRLPTLHHVQRAWSSWHLALPAVFGLGALVTLSKTGAISQFALLRKGVGLILLLVSYACLVDFFQNWDRIRWLLRIFLRAVVLNAGVAVVAMVVVDLGGPVAPLINAPWPGLRLSGLYLDPNAFGGLLALALVIHQMTYRSARPLLTGPWAWAAHLILPVGVALSFSRSSWIGLSLGLFVASLLRPRACGKALLRIAAPLLLLAPIALAQVPGVADLITRPSQVESRLVIGADAFAEFAHSPLVGMGLGEYSVKYGVIVHNTVLWFLAEFGVIGLVVIVGFLASSAAKMLRAVRLGPVEQRPLIIALLAGHAVMLGVSIGIEALYQRHWWLVMAAGGAAYTLSVTSAERRSRDDRPAGLASDERAGKGDGAEPHRYVVPMQAIRRVERADEADEAIATPSGRLDSDASGRGGTERPEQESSGSSIRVRGG